MSGSVEHHPPLPRGPGAVEAGDDEQLTDPASLRRRVDDQHAERGLVVGGGHVPEVALQHEGDAAEDPAGGVADHEQVGAGRPPGDVGELGGVVGGGQPTVDVDRDRELRDRGEVLGTGGLHGQGRRGRDHVRRVGVHPTYARTTMTNPSAAHSAATRPAVR
jgi:hypothetical protein